MKRRIWTNKADNSKFIFARIMPLFGLEIFVKSFFFFFFSIPLIFLNSNVTRGHTFNPLPNKPWFLRVCSTSLFENTVGKREIAPNEQFLLSPHCFLPFCRTFRHIHQVRN